MYITISPNSLISALTVLQFTYRLWIAEILNLTVSGTQSHGKGGKLLLLYLYLVSQTHNANLPFEQLLTYCPTASGLQISDVSHVLSLIFKGPSRSLPLQDLKQAKALAKGCSFMSYNKIQKYKINPRTEHVQFLLKKFRLVRRATELPLSSCLKSFLFKVERPGSWSFCCGSGSYHYV